MAGTPHCFFSGQSGRVSVCLRPLSRLLSVDTAPTEAAKKRTVGRSYRWLDRRCHRGGGYLFSGAARNILSVGAGARGGRTPHPVQNSSCIAMPQPSPFVFKTTG